MNGKRYSRQRELIYQTLMETTEHPTADMVYQWLKPTNPNLSLGTVYRNLNLLANEGRITRMAFPVERYDGNTKPHCHFRCDVCGAVYDLDLPYCRDLDEKVDGSSQHKIEGHELMFHGQCVRCQEEEEALQKSS